MRYYDEPVYIPIICRLSDPTYIEITTQPTKTSYTEGESIDLTGAVVQAYTDEGTLWDGYPDGIIPLNQLTCVPQIVEGSNIYSDGDGVIAMLVPLTEHKYAMDGMGQHYERSTYDYSEALGEYEGIPCTVTAQGVANLLLTRYENRVYGKRLSGDNTFDLAQIMPSPYNGETFVYTAIDCDYYYSFRAGTNTKTVTTEFTSLVWHDAFTDLPTSTKIPTLAGTMYPDNAESITVSWLTPNGITLTDTFNITVN